MRRVSIRRSKWSWGLHRVVFITTRESIAGKMNIVDDIVGYGVFVELDVVGICKIRLEGCLL